MEWGHFKPLLSAMALPPASLLLLAALGLAIATVRRKLGISVAVLALVLLWTVSSRAVAVMLAHGLLPQPAPIGAAALAQVQAIVVLGGGVQAHAPEYGAGQPSAATLARLRYGLWLARRSGKPVAFSGGVGWAASPGSPAEGDVARRVAQEDFGVPLRWVDSQSRDTHENARRMAVLLRADQVTRVALVTDPAHMERSLREFRAAGLQPVAAPTGFADPARPPLDWLPSPGGLALSHHVLRERLGLLFTQP